MSTSPTLPASPTSPTLPTPPIPPTSISAETPSTVASVVTPVTAAEETPPKIAGAVVGQQPTVARRTTRSHAIALAAITVLAVSVIAFPRHPAPVHAPAAVDPKPEASQPPSDPEPVVQAGAVASRPARASAVAPSTRTTVQTKAAPRAVGETVNVTPVKPPQKAATSSPRVATESSMRVPAAASVVPPRAREASETSASVEPTVAVPPPAPPAETAAAIAPVTITGCLEVSVDGDRFRLADTEGASAPKARSWRSGFLKKRTVPVELVGDSGALGLKQQVGKRIAATGVQTSRELDVSSVRVVSASCD